MIRLLLCLLAVLPLIAAAGTTSIIRAAALLDVESGRVLPNPVVLVEGDKIVDINPPAVPTDAATIDLTGMIPLQAIQPGTIRTADLFGLEDRGKLEKGLRADIVAVPGNPLEDITLLQNVGFVMKAGVVYRSMELAGISY